MDKYENIQHLLADTFPEHQSIPPPPPPQKNSKMIGLLNSKIATGEEFETNEPRRYWANIEHRRAFLLEFAKKMGFDPMVAANWRNQRYQLYAAGVSFVPLLGC